MADDDKNPLEQIADLVVYAPLGAATYALEALPGLIRMLAERGRVEIERRQAEATNQLALARTLGQALAGRLLRRGQAGEEPVSAPAPSGNGESAIRRAQSVVGRALGDGASGASGNGEAVADLEQHRADVAEARAAAEGLAIPDYESLSAAQVNARLGALTPEELEAVRIYEDTHRGRRTILARIETLLSR